MFIVAFNENKNTFFWENHYITKGVCETQSNRLQQLGSYSNKSDFFLKDKQRPKANTFLAGME